MERLLKMYLPCTGITFMATIVCMCVSNLLEGYTCLDNRVVLQILGFIIGMEGINGLLGRIEFKSYVTYFLVEAGISYIILLLCNYFWNWFSFTPGRMLKVTIIFLLIMAAVHYYFYCLAKSSADEINELLQEKEK